MSVRSDRRRLPRLLLLGESAAILLASALALPTAEAVPSLLVVLPVVTYGWLGARIAERAPRNPVGWLVSAAATAAAFGMLAAQYASFGTLHDSPSLPAADQVGLTAAVLTPATVGVSLMLTFLLFPTGRPPSSRWWPVAWTTIATGAVAMVAVFLSEIETTDRELAKLLDTAFIALAASASALTVLSLIVRSRRGTKEERAPIRGLLYTLAAMAGSFGVFVWQANDENWSVFVIVAALTLTAGTLVLIPLALTVSMIRYGLFDYEVGVRKRIAARVLAGIIMLAIGFALFTVTTGVGGVMLAGDQDDRMAPTMVAIAIGAVAGMALIVLARWARRFADRVVFRDRATPYEVLSGFSDRIGDGYSLDDVLPRMAALLASGTGAATAAVWLEADGDLRPLASAPAGMIPPPLTREGDELSCEDPGTHAFAVQHHGEFLGALSVTMPSNDPMNAAKEHLVEGLANQAGLVLRNVSLLEDVRESRRRIVQAQDDRARTLERNIHDGAQQQLVALAVKLRLADSLVDKDPAKARQLLTDLQGEATEALETLRDLARGIYPPLLADKGLPAALAAQSRRTAVPVEIDHDSVGRYPQEIESAVYFCALEALNNTVKYSGATKVRIRLEAADGELRFEITDDGVGFDSGTARSGTGLQGMADRLDAVGGRLEIRSAPGAGATVAGRIPSEPVA